MKKPALNHIIEAYLRDDLSPEERNAFERRLQADEQLSTLLRKYQDPDEVIGAYREAQLESHYIQETRRLLRRRTYLRTGGALVLLLAILFVVFQILPNTGEKQDTPGIQENELAPKSDEEIKQALSAPVASLEALIEKVEQAPRASVLLSEGDNLRKRWSNVVSLYNQQQYDEFISATQPLLSEAEFARLYGDEAKLLIGYSYEQLGDPVRAKASYEAIADKTNAKDEAAWYLSLMQLKAGEIEASIATIRQISANQFHRKHDKAQEFIEGYEALTNR